MDSGAEEGGDVHFDCFDVAVKFGGLVLLKLNWRGFGVVLRLMDALRLLALYAWSLLPLLELGWTGVKGS